MRYLFAVGIVLAPTVVLAAGFAPQSIFLSKSPVTEGDTVKIYTIVSNTAAAKFTGNVVIKEGTTKIGSTAVSLAAGATQTTSVSWTPAAGTHNVVADLEATDGTVAEEKSATFTIAEKPKPAAPPKVIQTQPNSAAVDSSQFIQDKIAGVSPQAENFVAPVFNWLDGARLTMSKTLEGQLFSAGQHINTGKVEGDQTQQLPDTMGGFWYVLWTLYFYVLTLLNYLISNAAVFYPVAALAFLYLLWKLFKRFRRRE